MVQTTKSICIVGAGAAGLISIKECLDESHAVTCFESDGKVGGTWAA